MNAHPPKFICFVLACAIYRKYERLEWRELVLWMALRICVR